jgi:putative ABC transport system permease protein
MEIKSLRTATVRTATKTMLAMMVFRSLRNNLRISLWTLLTLATCAALVTLFTTVTLEIRSKMNHALRRLGANAVAYPMTRGNTDWTDFERVAQSRGVRFVRLSVRVGLIQESPVAIVVANAQALQELTPYWTVTGKRPGATNECLVGRHAAEVLGLKPGQRVNIEWPDGSRPISLAVVGVAESGDEDDDRVFTVSSCDASSQSVSATPPSREETKRRVAFAGQSGDEGSPLLSATRASQPPSDFSYALLSVAGDGAAIAKIQGALATSSDIEVKPLRQIVRGEEHVLGKIRILCLTVLGAVLALTALGVSASMLARVVERKKEFALLQALGAQRRSVVKFLLAESATVGGLAAVAGFVLGTLLGALVMWQIFRVTISPHVLAFAAALVVTTAVALLAGAIACQRILRLQPAAVLKGE